MWAKRPSTHCSIFAKQPRLPVVSGDKLTVLILRTECTEDEAA